MKGKSESKPNGPGKCLEFRRLAPEDAPSLAAFFLALKNSGDEDLFHPHPLTEEQAGKICHYTGGDFFCAGFTGSGILCYGMLRGWDEGFAIPSLGIAVHPDARGRGHGKAFMSFLHAHAKEKGAEKVRLKVYSRNERAVNLYQELGYVFESSEAGQLAGTYSLVKP